MNSHQSQLEPSVLALILRSHYVHSHANTAEDAFVVNAQIASNLNKGANMLKGYYINRVLNAVVMMVKRHVVFSHV